MCGRGMLQRHFSSSIGVPSVKLASIKITGKKSDEQKKKKAKQELDAATKKLHIAMYKKLALEEKMDSPGADA